MKFWRSSQRFLDKFWDLFHEEKLQQLEVETRVKVEDEAQKIEMKIKANVQLAIKRIEEEAKIQVGHVLEVLKEELRQREYALKMQH